MKIDSHVLDKPIYAQIKLGTLNLHLPSTSLYNFSKQKIRCTNNENTVVDTQLIWQLQTIPHKNMKFVLFVTNLQSENKDGILKFPIDFG